MLKAKLYVGQGVNHIEYFIDQLIYIFCGGWESLFVDWINSCLLE